MVKCILSRARFTLPDFRALALLATNCSTMIFKSILDALPRLFDLKAPLLQQPQQKSYRREHLETPVELVFIKSNGAPIEEPSVKL